MPKCERGIRKRPVISPPAAGGQNPSAAAGLASPAAAGRDRDERSVAPGSRPPGEQLPRNLHYALRPSQLRPGNQVRLLYGGGEAFPAMLAAIAQAKRSICLETYILRADSVGFRFAQALCKSARAGVAVRFIYDGFGCISLDDDYLNTLVSAGVQLLEYHPIVPWKQHFALQRRDHRKILVVDDRVAFTGGINISAEYAPAGDSDEHGWVDGHGWHDIHCQLWGPIVFDLARLFRRVWVREGGAPYPVPRGHAPISSELPEATLVRVLDNRKFRKRWSIRRAYLHAINRAVRTIDLMNAYFLPDHGICWALRRAVRRGVRVRVIVPEVSDVPVVSYASQHLYGSLLHHGIEILCWPDRMMHAKTAVIDAMWATIGSYNLDNRSLLYNLEVAVEILDPDFGAEMAARFEDDARLCRPLSRAVWENRPHWDKALSWLCYQFRHRL